MTNKTRRLALFILLAFATAVMAQPSNEPNPGFDGFIKMIQMASEQGHQFQTPVRMEAAAPLFFDPLDPELGEFFSQFGVALVAMQMGDWRDTKSALAAVNLEQQRLVTSFGDNGIVRVDYPLANDWVTNVFVQPDGRIVAAGYTGEHTVTQMAIARFLKNGAPDPTFGNNGYAVYSEHPSGSTAMQYNELFAIFPRYNAEGRVLDYVAGGVFSSEAASGRAIVCFDSSGNVIKKTTVQHDSDGVPVILPDQNGAIVRGPWGEVNSLTPFGGGGFYSCGSGSDGSWVEQCFMDSETFEITGPTDFFNPDPSDYPDNRVRVRNAAYQPDSHALFVAGEFRSDSQDPRPGGGYAPFLCRSMLSPDGAPGPWELLELPAPPGGYESLMIDGVFSPVPFSSLGPSYKRNRSGSPIYLSASSDRRDDQGQWDHDFFISRYLPDGSMDENFGDQGAVVLDFGAGDVSMQMAFMALDKLLVCANSGEEILLGLLNADSGTAVRRPAAVVSGFELHPVYPNPFNPSAVLSFRLPRPEHVRLDVYDITGRRVETLRTGTLPAGAHRVVWNGAGMASGTYIVRLETPSCVMTRKAVLLR
ncbi:T9SS type A sorting domain-containing protein [bacterium]|nr:T9SS type A sorting domain-containing protein [bacterium]